MNLNATKIKAHIAMIRESVNIFLIDTAILKRRTGVQYINGEPRPVYAAPIEIQCRLITRSGSEGSNIAAQPRQVEQTSFTGLYRMQIPYDQDIDITDHLIITDNVSGAEKTLEVIYAPAKHDYTGAVVIQLKEVR